MGKTSLLKDTSFALAGKTVAPDDTTADKGDAKDHPDQFSYDTHSKLL